MFHIVDILRGNVRGRRLRSTGRGRWETSSNFLDNSNRYFNPQLNIFGISVSGGEEGGRGISEKVAVGRGRWPSLV